MSMWTLFHACQSMWLLPYNKVDGQISQGDYGHINRSGNGHNVKFVDDQDMESIDCRWVGLAKGQWSQWTNYKAMM